MDTKKTSIAPWLLRSKVTPSRQLMTLVDRPHLTERLNDGGKGCLIVLEAPGGYGKSCLLSEWRAERVEEGDTVCWLSVDEDDDLETFVAYLAFAAHTAGVECNSTNLMSFEFSTDKDPIQAIYQFLALLEHHDNPIRFVIDDYERLSDVVRDVIMPPLLRRLPEHVTLVLASRETVSLNTVDLDHRGLVTRFGPGQLQFSRDEMTSLWGTRLSKRQLERLAAQTEGWPVLVRMLLSASEMGSFDIRHIDEISYGDGAITTYFEQKILTRLDEDVRSFLLAASVFSEVTHQIISDVIGFDLGSQTLAKLDALEAFISPLSGEQSGYRLHPMMRNYLVHKFRENDPSTFESIQAKAAYWYSAQGNHVRAVRHALACADTEFVSVILEATGGLSLWLQEGLIQFRSIDRYLEHEIVLSSPTAGMMRVLILMKRGQQAEAVSLYDQIITQHRDRIAADKILVASALACRIMLSSYRGLYISAEDVGTFQSLVEDVPTSSDSFLGFVLTMNCVSAHQAGLLEKSIGYGLDAISVFRKIGSVYGEFYIHLHLAMIYGLILDDEDRDDEFRRATNIVRRDLSYDDGVKPLYAILQYESDHERLPFETSSLGKLSTTVHKTLKGEGWIDIYAAGFRTLTEKTFLTGSGQEALLSLDTFFEFAARNDMAYLLDICRAQRCILLHLMRREEDAAQEFQQLSAYRSDPTGYLHKAPWRASEAIGEAALMLSLDGTVNSDIGLWQQYRDRHTELGNLRLASRLTALLAQHQPHPEAEFQILDQVLSPRFLRSVIFCQDRLRDKIDQLSKEDEYPNFRSCVRAVRDGMTEHATSQSKQTLLTDKESAVIQELSTGLSDKQIALQLGISEHGVRYHLKNIYLKLGAKNRMQAVHKIKSIPSEHR